MFRVFVHAPVPSGRMSDTFPCRSWLYIEEVTLVIVLCLQWPAKVLKSTRF